MKRRKKQFSFVRLLSVRLLGRTGSILAFSVLVGSVLAGSVLGDEAGPLRAIQQDQGWLVREGGRDVLFYQQAVRSQDGKYPRANYLHPLYSLDGAALTEDFPRDHLHHRGIFWAWHQVIVGDRPIGDPWVCRDFLWDVEKVEPRDEGPDAVALHAHVLWKSPQRTTPAGELKPLAREETTLRVHRAADEARKIDFEIRLLALEENLRLGGSDDAKGYGGFSVRVRLPPEVRFLGQQGDVEPQTTSVEAGPWLDVLAPFDGQQLSGVAILQHASLPGYPQRWILRRQASMQNPVWPGREPAPLSTTEPLVLKYRLVLHRGAADAARLNRWLAEYHHK